MADTKTDTPQEKWKHEIEQAEKELKKFHERGDAVNKKFLDERNEITAQHKWFNIFYANTNILESALYSQIPKPIVSRRFKDYEDEVARVAGIILQRNITQDLDDPRDTFDSMMRHAVQDRLVPGLSQAWLRLETDTEVVDDVSPEPQPEMEVGDEVGGETEPLTRITDQRVCVDYVYWKDFIYSPCRVWEERRWVGRKIYMDKQEAVKRFGEEKCRTLSFEETAPHMGDTNSMTPKNNAIKKSCIYEIWNRSTKTVIFFSKDATELLEEKPDPLGLVGFEPCPTPMLANVSTSNATPRPDHYMLQDQYNELDTVNQRISLLIQACKVVGVYDKSAEGIQRMLKEGFDNQLIPVDNWAMFAEKNGLKGQIDWLPLDQVVAALAQLNLARETIKGQIYELTGIADIVRGASKASETLGAQQIKAQFASVRIKKLQDEVARFAGEVLRIKGEIMVKHFEPELLVTKSNIQNTPDAMLVGRAIELLKSDSGFEWRIEVTADSIAQADYAMEKQDRIEFLTAVSSYLEKAGMMFEAVPQSAALLIGMLKWAVAGFRNANEIEGMMDKELDSLGKNPPQDKPDPEAEKAKMEQQKLQQDMQLEQQRAALEERRQQMELQFEQQMNAIKLQAEQQKMAMDRQQQQMDMMFERLMQALELKGAKDKQELALEGQRESNKLAKQKGASDE